MVALIALIAAVTWTIIGAATGLAATSTASPAGTAQPAPSPHPALRGWLDGGPVVSELPAERPGLCDFATLAKARNEGLSAEDDPVFRPVRGQAKAGLGALRKRALSAKPDSDEGRAAAAALAAYARGPAGPSALRWLLREDIEALRVIVLRAAAPLAREHPRLAAFAAGWPGKAKPAVAKAAVDLMVATGCDVPALYALDALEHESLAVQLHAVDALARLLARHRDAGVLSKALRRARANDAVHMATRGLLARLAGGVGALTVTDRLLALRDDSSELVRAEVAVALARLGHPAADEIVAPSPEGRGRVRRKSSASTWLRAARVAVAAARHEAWPPGARAALRAGQADRGKVSWPRDVRAAMRSLGWDRPTDAAPWPLAGDSSIRGLSERAAAALQLRWPAGR